MINLRQAAYKPLKISGKIRATNGPLGTIFLGQAAPVMAREVVLDDTGRVLMTKHSTDMKILDSSPALESVTGHSLQSILGVSFFELIHGEDCQAVLESFRNCK